MERCSPSASARILSKSAAQTWCFLRLLNNSQPCSPSTRTHLLTLTSSVFWTKISCPHHNSRMIQSWEEHHRSSKVTCRSSHPTFKWAVRRWRPGLQDRLRILPLNCYSQRNLWLMTRLRHMIHHSLKQIRSLVWVLNWSISNRLLINTWLEFKNATHRVIFQSRAPRTTSAELKNICSKMWLFLRNLTNEDY